MKSLLIGENSVLYINLVGGGEYGKLHCCLKFIFKIDFLRKINTLSVEMVQKKIFIV